MKPAGSIPADYLRDTHELAIAGRPVSEILTNRETPCFVYDRAIVTARVARLRAALPGGVAIHYAVKANPYPPLLRAIGSIVDGLDIASGGELARVIDAGFNPGAVSFAGPGKRDAELRAAVNAGVTINLESEGELERALSIAGSLGRTPRLAIRVNPDFELRGSGLRMGGGAKPFGIDADRAAAAARRVCEAGAEWRGFHVYAGTQSLDAEAIVDAQRQTVALVARLSEEVGASPPLVNLGGGFGIPHFAGEEPLDIEAIGAALADTLAGRPVILRETLFALELGRWLVGEAGVYLTRVVDRKESGGQTFLVTDGGLHHQLAASGNFGAAVRRNYPVAIASRWSEAASEVATVVGCLCTPLDRLADQVALPRADRGDVVAIFMAGAYGATASPAAFLGHGPAEEVLL